VFLFSAARQMKYRSVDGVSFADSHVAALKAHPNAELWVLGAGNPADWSDAIAAVGGRIKPLPESPDTTTMFEAADIYVDSFPFVSSTSMMEAARIGTPLVSRFYGPQDARIFAINHPGIDKPTLHATSEDEYTDNLKRLIGDAALREQKGREAREAVEHFHTPPSWLSFLEPAYEMARTLPPVDGEAVLAREPEETFSFGEPDKRLYDIFGFGAEASLLKLYPPLMPLKERIAFTAELKNAGVLNGRAVVRALLPEWAVRILKDRR
jgi:hypothetical protein